MDGVTDLADMTAVELLRGFKSGEFSPVEAARAALDRIERYNGAVNAFCYRDDEATLVAARASEQRWHRGTPRGLLDGVPIAVKDVFLMRGWPNLKGSRTIDPAGPWEVDAPVICALERHGYVPVGKTTTPEFGWKGVTDSPLCGPTGNPWAPHLTAGGSSGGSGAAVPLGMGAAALGTDAGGSIRIPSAFCGLVGHKPTRGRVPLWPPSPFGELAHPGPMTHSVEDAALLMQVLSEPDWRDPSLPPMRSDFLTGLAGDLRGWRIAFSPDLGCAEVHPEIAARVRTAVERLEELGADVEEVEPPFDSPSESFERLFYGGAANAVFMLDEERRRLIDPRLAEAASQAAQTPLLDYLRATNERAALIERMSGFHRHWDLLVTPTLPIEPFTAGLEVPEGWPSRRWHTWSPFTWPFNLTGQPALSLPVGFTSAGLPVGLQLVGPRHRDEWVLQAAYRLEQALELPHRRPSMLVH